MNLIARLSRKLRGEESERAAEAHLIRHGLALVTRNFRTRFGEIDLIMRDGETLVFIEVRYRNNDSFGGALASIGPAKQQRLIAAAEHYLAQFRRPPPCRFDAVLLSKRTNETTEGTVEWLKDAFQT